MGIEEHFSSRARGYDYRREDVVPGFESFYSVYEDLLEPGITLDLGAGTGLLSKRLEGCGHEVVPLDISEGMLREARSKGVKDALLADMRELPLRGPFDSAVSALAIHHLEAGEKRRLYGAVHDLLKPGGRFVHGDMVRSRNPDLQERYMDLWHRRMVERGLEERAERFLEGAEEHDVYEPLDRHLEWLRGAGFEGAECYWKRYNFAVFGGKR